MGNNVLDYWAALDRGEKITWSQWQSKNKKEKEALAFRGRLNSQRLEQEDREMRESALESWIECNGSDDTHIGPP